MKHTITITYNNKPLGVLNYENGLYSETKTPCDNEGFVYSVDKNGNKFKKSELLSDGTKCDNEGFVYSVDSDGYKYKLYEHINVEQCDAVKLNLEIKIDNEKNNPNYYISDVDDNLIIKQKWDSLEINIPRNNSQLNREMSLIINHNMDASLRQKINIIQVGDIYNIDFQDKETIQINTNDDLLKIKPHLLLQQIPSYKEIFSVDINVNGGNEEFFVKNIEQFIITDETQNIVLNNFCYYKIGVNKVYCDDKGYVLSETLYGEKYQLFDDYGNMLSLTEEEYGFYYKIDVNKVYCDKDGNVLSETTDGKNYQLVDENGNRLDIYNIKTVTDVINDEINKLNDEINKLNEKLNIKTIPSTIIESELLMNEFKLQSVLNYFYENGKFENYDEDNLFKNSNNELTSIIVDKNEIVYGKQIIDNFNYTEINITEEIETIKQINYDGGLNCIIQKNRIIFENYGRLFLDAKNSIYKVILAHKNDFTKTLNVYLKYCDEKQTEAKTQLFSLKPQEAQINKIIEEDLIISHKKGVKKFFIQNLTTFKTNAILEKSCEWLHCEVINNFVHITYDDNTYNFERNNVVLIKIGDVLHKQINVKQTSYDDYNITIDSESLFIEYNEEPFFIKINVYGGDKDFLINKENFPYNVNKNLYYEGTYFNIYHLVITPTINDTHKYINSTLKITHINDFKCNNFVNIKQNMNVSTIENTILCDNILLLKPMQQTYSLKYETYPLQNSELNYELNANWVKIVIKQNNIHFILQTNNGKKRSTLLKLTNKDFPFKRKFIKIIQEGIKK